MRDTSLLRDDLIRPPQDRLLDCQPQRLRGLEIEERLVLGGLLDWEIARLCAFQDPVDENRRASIDGIEARSIGHQARGVHMVPEPTHAGHPVQYRQLGEACSME